MYDVSLKEWLISDFSEYGSSNELIHSNVRMFDWHLSTGLKEKEGIIKIDINQLSLGRHNNRHLDIITFFFLL